MAREIRRHIPTDPSQPDPVNHRQRRLPAPALPSLGPGGLDPSPLLANALVPTCGPPRASLSVTATIASVVTAGIAATTMPSARRSPTAAAPADPARRRAVAPVVDGRGGQQRRAGSGRQPGSAAAPLAAATRSPRGRAAVGVSFAQAGGGSRNERGHGTAAGSTFAESTKSTPPETLRSYSQAKPGDVLTTEFSLGHLGCYQRAHHFEWYLGLVEGKHTVIHVSMFGGTCSMRVKAGATLS